MKKLQTCLVGDKMKRFFAFLFIILFLAGCKAPEEPAVEAEQAKEAAPAEPVVTEQIVEPVEQYPTIIPTTNEPVSDLKCDGSKIEGIITNIIDKPITLVDDVKVILHGRFVVHSSLMECDKETLQPGESTYCNKINGQFPVAEKTRIIFRITGTESGIEKTIDCPK